MVSGDAGLFQESPGGFRKGCVLHERLGGVSGKVWWCQESLGWFQERLRGEGCVVAGKAGRFQESLDGFRLGAGFRNDWAASGKARKVCVMEGVGRA